MRIISHYLGLVTVILFTALLTNAQSLPSGKFSDHYKEMAEKETQTMRERYSLTNAQLTNVTKLNNEYYADINTEFSETKSTSGLRDRILLIRTNREAQLKKLLTKEQFTAYRKDMDIQELKAKQREKRQNELSRKHQVKIMAVPHTY